MACGGARPGEAPNIVVGSSSRRRRGRRTRSAGECELTGGWPRRGTRGRAPGRGDGAVGERDEISTGGEGARGGAHVRCREGAAWLDGVRRGGGWGRATVGRHSGGEVQRRRSGTASGDGVGVEAAMTGRRGGRPLRWSGEGGVVEATGTRARLQVGAAQGRGGARTSPGGGAPAAPCIGRGRAGGGIE